MFALGLSYNLEILIGLHELLGGCTLQREGNCIGFEAKLTIALVAFNHHLYPSGELCCMLFVRTL